MCHSDRLSGKHGCPPGKCRRQRASSYQLLEGLPQLQMNSLLQSHTLPGATTSCRWARQGLKGPELRTRLAEALFSLHHSLFSPFSKILFPLPSLHKYWSLINTLHPKLHLSVCFPRTRLAIVAAKSWIAHHLAGHEDPWLVAGGAQQPLAQGGGPVVRW